MPKRLGLTFAALVAVALALPAAAVAVPFGPADGHSPNADDSIAAYWVMFVIAVVIIVAINGALIAAALRFRARRGQRPRRTRASRRVQWRVGLALAVIAALVFVVGVVTTGKVRDVEPSGPEGLQAASQRTAQLGIEPPAGDAEPLRILASGQQWVWRYEYPNGTFSFYEMVVPVDTTVLITLDSTDVVHRWSIPELGGKFEVDPGRQNETWFKADEEGVYDGQASTFSGPGYATMRARVRVVSVPEYEAWLERQSDEIDKAQEAVQERVDRLADEDAARAVDEVEVTEP